MQIRNIFLLLLCISFVACDESDPKESMETGSEIANSEDSIPQDVVSSPPGNETATRSPNRSARELKKEPADLVTKFQYAYFERRFDDFHSLLSEKDRKARPLRIMESEFNDMTLGEDIMTTYILGSSDYHADSTYTISPDSIVVFGASTAPLLENVQREVSVVLRDVGEDEEYGMLLSLLTERLKLRGGKKERLSTEHLVVRENGVWRIRVGFDAE